MELVKTETAVAVQPSEDAAPILAVIARAASDDRVDVAKMQALLDMQERVMRMQAEAAFNQSMQAAQSEMQPIVRDALNKHTGSKYARLETIDAQIRPIYTKHGFSLSFNSAPAAKPGAARVLCKVMHVAGHSLDYELEGDLDVAGAQGKSNKTSIQGLGSSVSYLRRYLTTMAFNITLKNEDDDGQGDVRIAEEDAQRIEDLINECELKPEQVHKFLADYMGVEKVREIRRRDAPRGMRLLSDTLKRIRSQR